MKVKHLKNQLRSFTLASGKSLYLYPMAQNIEITEQDFYLTKRLQSYMKDEAAIQVQEEEKSFNNVSTTDILSIEKPKKVKKKKSVEE